MPWLFKEVLKILLEDREDAFLHGPSMALGISQEVCKKKPMNIEKRVK